MDQNTQINNKRIAKNTLMLYFRMLLTMGVSLYTSRVILQALGVTDYGVYNVVGGIISMFGFLNGALSGATQRYLTFSIAENDNSKSNKVFCTSVVIHSLMSLVIIVLAETIGLWFLNNRLNIPADRMIAANWVYQCSIISAVVMFLSVPYNALIIAHERMSAFAYISIVEVLLKLMVAFAVMIAPTDKLIFYAILILLIQITIRLIYGRYCNKHFAESKFHLVWNKAQIKEMTSFAGWNLFGSLASVLSTQGENILLNIFFGPVVNAARGVAVQIQGAILNFCTNFQMAVNPQITKTYAVNDLQSHHKLLCASAKFSTLLVMILSMPVLIYTNEILSIWLTEVPNYTVTFVRIILLTALVDSSMGPFIVSIRAYGKIRNAQIIEGSIILMILPVSYVLLKFLEIPMVVLYVHLAMAFFAQLARICLVHKYVNLTWNDIRRIYVPILLTFILILSASLSLKYVFFTNSVLCTVVLVITTVVIGIALAYFMGTSSQEKYVVTQVVKNKLRSK